MRGDCVSGQRFSDESLDMSGEAMILFLNAYEVDDAGLPSVVAQAKLSRLTVDFITSIRATVVSLGMYPPGSKTIENAVEKVSKNLQNVLELQDSITFSEINGLLLVDGQQLDERDRKKAPIIDFIASMMERNIQSITYKKRTSSKELVDFLVLMAKKPKELQALGPMPEQMEKAAINNIKIDERIYVATTQEEQEESKHREELLAKFLLNEAGDINPNELGDMLQDKTQFSDILKSLVKDKEKEKDHTTSRKDYVDTKAKQVTEILKKSAGMLRGIKDEEQKQVFIEGLTNMASELEGDIIGKILHEEKLNPTAISEMGLESIFFEQIPREKAMDLVEYIVEQVEALKRIANSLSEEERRTRINAIKAMVKDLVQHTMNRDFFPVIAQKLVDAGLLRREVAEKLTVQAEEVTEAANVGTMSLVGTDGSVNEGSLEKVIANFSRLPAHDIPRILASLAEIMGEVVFHPGVEKLVDAIIHRLESELDTGSVFTACMDFLEKMCKELIFNENYSVSLRIVQTFHALSSSDADRPMDQKKRAIHALDTIGSDDVNRMLLTVYQHGEEAAKEKVGELVIHMGGRMLNALLDLLKSSEERRVRRAVITLLQKMGVSILDSLRQELNDTSAAWYYTRNMIVLISEIGGADQVAWIQPLLGHNDARVRKAAIKALTDLDPGGSMEVVRGLIGDRDLSVKRHVVSMLGILRDRESIPTIAAMLVKRNIAQVEEDEGLQLDAVSALGKMNDESVVPVLFEVLKREGMFSKLRTKSPQLRARACLALAGYRGPEITKMVKSLVKDRDQVVADAAKSILPQME